MLVDQRHGLPGGSHPAPQHRADERRVCGAHHGGIRAGPHPNHSCWPRHLLGGADGPVIQQVCGQLVRLRLGLSLGSANSNPKPCDGCCVSGHGGHTVFVGPPGVAVLYFHHGLGFTLPPRENPADVLMDILGGKVPREGNTRYKPGMLPSWWTVKGHAWVQEFEELNQGHKASRGHWRLLAACTGCY
ncbi:uncharacterized protein HaLaN_16545 [Haematococcus lacustris]|uniref:ABC transporter family G domain-containing protein n=1 Tax=Haematococcus lacustris TaxID=44745 RepID=A0A699ZE87_HAELA|nr:uncharacterized protein HaLaN_16545 [Haematococcus lacustris]